MPGAAKKLVVVQNNEPEPEATVTPATRSEELRLLEALLFAAGEPLDEANVTLCGSLGVMTSLEFFQHDFA